MASGLTVSYNNTNIVNTDSDGTFTLSCAGKIMSSDVVISATDVNSVTATYNNQTIVNGSGTHTYTLSCSGKYMSTDVGIGVSMPSAIKPTQYITFSSPDIFTIYTNNHNTKSWNGTLYYSTDKNVWKEWIETETITAGLNNNTYYVYICGVGNTRIGNSGKSGRWNVIGSNVSCSGNIESLLDWETVENGNHPPMIAYAFASLFSGVSSIISAPSLPATTLAEGCYSSMFVSTSLTTAPSLPATKMEKNCYNAMFNSCQSLTTAPSLPATTLAEGCYSSMFGNCQNLTTIPSLRATKMAKNCYNGMVRNCSNIKISQYRTGIYQTAYRIPKSGSGSTATGALSYMFTNTGGTFTSDPTLNTTYYTSNTVV